MIELYGVLIVLTAFGTMGSWMILAAMILWTIFRRDDE